MKMDKGLMRFRRLQGKHYWELWKETMWTDWRKGLGKIWEGLGITVDEHEVKRREARCERKIF